MEVTIINFRKLTSNWVFWLIIITIAAVIIRSIPAWINAAWGCDFGIYFGITKNVIQSGTFFPLYTGWGGSYNELEKGTILKRGVIMA